MNFRDNARTILYPSIVAFSVAAAGLLLQIVQTQIYAVVFWNHLVYFIVSVALLGFGISGTWLSFGRTTPLARFLTLRNAALGFVVSAIVSSLIMPQFSATQGATLSSAQHVLRLMLTYSTAVLPYFFGGWILGVLYRDYAEHIHFLYCADLVGAAMGCLLDLALIRPLGAVPLVLLACAIVAFPILLGGSGQTGKVLATVLLIVLAVFLGYAGPISARILPDRTKGFYFRSPNMDPRDERVIERSEWNSLCRTDVAGTLRSPKKGFFINGDAYTGMELDAIGDPPPLDPDKEPLVPEKTPYLLSRPRDSVLVIGSGGGHDVWNALRAGARHVDAVEINPSTARFVTHEYCDFTHGLFLRPEVTLWNEEGRSFVRRGDSRYDAVMIIAIDTFAAHQMGAYMLAENYLYTVEAIKDYVRHLTPQGVLCITRWNGCAETPRLFTIMLEAAYELGYPDPERHVAAASRNPWTAIIVSPTAFSDDEIKLLHSHTEKYGGAFYYPVPAGQRNVPFQKDLFAYATARRSAGQEPFFQAYQDNVRPVRDDSPFFFNNEKLGVVLSSLWNQPALYDLRWHLASLTLVLLLILVTVALAFLVFLPLVRRGWGDLPHVGGWLLYFCCLGLAFIFVEISLMQRFALLVGHPARSLALVLASLLFFAGVGSYAKAWLRVPLPLALAALVGVILAAAFLYPYLIVYLLPLPLWERGVATVTMVAPMALFMGMPFPTGMQVVSRKAIDAVPWMWGVNGGATVLGSILAITLAIYSNFTVVLVTAACGYALALIVFARLSRRTTDA